MQKVEGKEKLIVAGMFCCWLEVRKKVVSFEDTTPLNNNAPQLFCLIRDNLKKKATVSFSDQSLF